MNSTRFVPTLAMAMLISACGGGGGGGNAGDGGAGPVQPAPEPPELVNISGQITFDLVPAVSLGMGLSYLDYAATVSSPVRHVTVQAVDSATGALLNATSADDEGAYAMTVPVSTNLSLRVRAELLRAGSPGWNVRVVDNVQDDALYVLDGVDFDSGTTDSTRNLHAGSGWTGQSYTAPRAAAPFAILDAITDGMEFLLAVDPALAFPPLTLHWSPDNNQASGADGFPDPETGEIGVSFFSPQLGGIFLLGQEDQDTEEYDRGIILHEWGHYLENAFFRSDSIGGPHTLGDRLDMRVAFSEGFASALAGMVLGNGLLIDTLGPRQSFGFTIDVENVTGLNSGWYSEESVQGILFDLFDTVQDNAQDQLGLGFEPIFDVLTNDVRDSVALTSLFPFVVALKEERGPSEAPLIDDLVSSQTIAEISDDYGQNRTNPISPDDADVLPIYTDIVVNGGPVSGICSTDAFGDSLADPESVNKLGSRRYLRFSTTVAGQHTFSATATVIPPGETTDPDMELHQRGLLLPFPLVDPPGKSSDPDVETFSWPLTPGDYVLEVYEWTNTNQRDDPDFPPIGRSCFDVEVTTP